MLVVGACVSVDEFITFRNDIYLDLNHTDHFDNVMSRLAWDVVDKRPHLKDDLEACLRGGFRDKVKREKRKISSREQ